MRKAVLLIDGSPSIGYRSKRASKPIERFLEKLVKGVKSSELAIIGFGGEEPVTEKDFSGPVSVKELMDKLPYESSRGTEMTDALHFLNTWAVQRKLEQPAIFVLSDFILTADDEKGAESAVLHLRSKGWTVYGAIISSNGNPHRPTLFADMFGARNYGPIELYRFSKKG